MPILQLTINIAVSVRLSRDGHGSGRPAGRVGSGRVGLRVRVKANVVGQVGSGRVESKFLKCVICQST